MIPESHIFRGAPLYKWVTADPRSTLGNFLLSDKDTNLSLAQRRSYFEEVERPSGAYFPMVPEDPANFED